MWRDAAVLGPFIKCPHPEIIEACALAGFSFGVVDMEHTPLSPRDVYPLVLAAEARDFNLVVRVPEKSEPYIKWCLDMGVRYVQVPHVESAADAEFCVKQARFYPDGERGLCRFVRAAEFSALPRAEYLPRANRRTRLIMQIEGRRGFEALEAIAAVPGIDCVFVGPYDLSQSLGKPGQIWDPEVVAAVEKVVRVCGERGLAVGTFTDTPEGLGHWRKLGVKLIEYASDLDVYIQGARQVAQGFKRALLSSAP